MSEKTPSLANRSAQQLSLSIFEEALGNPPPITDAPASIGFMKSHASIDVSDLGLASRKTLNVCHFIACADLDRESYEVDLGYFKWMINMPNTKNTSYLRQALRDAQKSAVQVNIIDPQNPNRDAWISVQMIATTGISNGRVFFTIPNHFKEHLRNERARSFLSFRIAGALTSLYAAELYERLLPYVEVGSTPWLTLDEARRMTGSLGAKTGLDFRYFKRDVLNVALTQINDMTDLNVEMLTKTARGSRKVEFIMFKIIRDKNALNFGTTLKDLYVVLKEEFALTDDQLSELMDKEYQPTRIWEAVEYTRFQMTKRDLDYPGKYLLKAVEEGYRLAPTQKARKAVTAKTQEETYQAKLLGDQKTEKKAQSVTLDESVWNAWPASKLAAGWEQFRQTSQGRMVCKRKTASASMEEHLSDPLVKQAFGAFLKTSMAVAS